jgi:hypothetical protein
MALFTIIALPRAPAPPRSLGARTPCPWHDTSRSPLTPLRAPLPPAPRPVACRSPWSHALFSHEATQVPSNPACHGIMPRRAVTRGHGPPCCHGASLPCAPALPSALAFFLQRGTVASVVRGAVQRGRLPGPSQAMAGSTPCDAAAPGSARGLPRSVWRPALPTMRPLPPDGGEPRPRKTVIMKEHA